MDDNVLDASRPHGTWTEAVAPIVRKFEVAAATGFYAQWNAVGSNAVGALMKEMARLLDEDAREAIRLRDAAIKDILAKNARLLEIGHDAAGHVRRLEQENEELKHRLASLEARQDG